MSTHVPLLLQPELFGADEPAPRRPLAHATRHELAMGAWVDHLPEWLDGSDALFADLVRVVPWTQPEVPMYEHRFTQPRLSAWWPLDDPPPGIPGVVAELAGLLSEHHGVELRTVGVNLYRDGRDSVAWHGDRVARTLEQASVAIVSLGERRRFLLRPKGGGRSVRFDLGRGDLLVMGGTCQRTWQHAVPKVARAGPRLSVTYRERY